MDTDIPELEEQSCTRSQCRCLCGGGACRLCCRWCPTVKESTSTRITYVIFLLISIAVMTLMMSRRIQTKVMDLFSDRTMVCEWVGAGERCEVVLGYMAVYRLGLAITAYHLLLMLLTYRVTSSKGCRAGVHNGLWFYKVMLMVGLCIAVFLIPDPYAYFINTWMYIAMCGAGVFIIIQMVLLVFMVHSWTDAIVRRVNDGASACCWYGGVVAGVTLVAFCSSVGVVVALYYYFATGEQCHRNQWLILINAVACVIVTIVAGCKRGRTRLLLRLFQSSLITLYVQYLTWTAIASAPRTFRDPLAMSGSGSGRWSSRYSSISSYQRYYCGPRQDQMTWTDDCIPYVSVVIMFVTVVYASIGTAQPDNCNSLNFPDCPVESNSPGEYIIEDNGGQKMVRNEKSRLSYSYPLFHIMLALATLFMMMSLTGWYTPTNVSLENFGRSWSAYWIKMGSSWVCLLIYFFTMIFPTLVPKKFRQHLTVTPDMSFHGGMSRAGSYHSGFGGNDSSGFGGGPAGNGYNHQPSGGGNGSARSVGRGFFGSSGSLGVAERMRRYSTASAASSQDAVPLSPSKKPATIVCHQETTV